MTLCAVIFDMDGLMLDTEQLNLRSFRQAMADAGFEESADVLYLQTVGMTDEATDRLLVSALGSAEVVKAVRTYEQQHMEAAIARDGVPLKPGLLALLDLLDQLRIPRAVASSRRRHQIDAWLAMAGLTPRLHALVGGDEIAHSKPAPDIFLRAANLLDVPPPACLVLEDSHAGIQAAHTAGMIPVMVPDLIPPSPLAREQAYRIVADLHAAGELIWQLARPLLELSDP